MPRREIFLLTVKGERARPGLTAALTETMGKHNVTVLDIGQAEIHDMLSLGMLIEAPAEPGLNVLKEIVFMAHHLGLTVNFTPISAPDYERWVAEQTKPRFTVTLLTRRLQAQYLAIVTKIIFDNNLNIDSITRLSGRVSLRGLNSTNLKGQRSALQFEVSGKPRNVDQMREELFKVSLNQPVDIAVQDDDLYRRNRRLILFDMDSTLIQCEVIDELAKKANVGKQVAEITEAAMRGELDFKESFKRRMRLLKGMDENVLQDIAEGLPITEGAPRLIANLKRLGYKVGILSGGFTYFARTLQKKLGIDYVHANELDFKDGKLTGEVKGEIVDGNRKAELLQEIAKKEGLSLKQVIAVGDGANDIPMLKLAGLGVAFHAKPKVKEQAKVGISTLGLDGILYLLGVRDREALNEVGDETINEVLLPTAKL
uniref:phosphoserine phosphatase n=1 Tax=Hanusia phi TaxID=3032 RepID=A0A7S0F6Q5_9CRYP